MNFSDALKYLKKGREIARPNWAEGDFIYLHSDYVWQLVDNENLIIDALKFDDILAEDWIVVDKGAAQ